MWFYLKNNIQICIIIDIYLYVIYLLFTRYNEI